MWQLEVMKADKELVEAGRFESVTAAAGRIRELEDYPAMSVIFSIYVDPDHGTDEKSFGHLEHKGRRAVYVVKRRTN